MSQFGKHHPCSLSQATDRSQRLPEKRSGFTLLEVLIATAVTLLMMISLAQIFKVIGDSMKQGRAALELNNRLRSVTYRIRLDIENMTANPQPPIANSSGTGYMQIYDGPLTDYTYGAILPSANRFGDADDIIMFTARAGDDWYTGKVPLFVLQGATPSATNTDLVTIAAQHAEICIFAEPVVTNDLNPGLDPYYLRMDPANNYAKLDTTDLPAAYRLYHRTLLIRPDLNLPSGVLPNGAFGGTDYLIAKPLSAVFNSITMPLPSPTCDMTGPHQQCDLSIRRLDPISSMSAVAANSLEDLVNPANRFAHVQLRLPVSGPPAYLSMPVLALSPRMITPGSITSSEIGTGIADTNPLNYQSSFLHPAFTLTGARTGEDLIAANVLAFDIKAYDPSAQLLALPGPDGGPGQVGFDDDGILGADNPGEYGWAGTDDLVVSPNDPGFIAALTSPSVIATGEYVDINWGSKVLAHGGSAVVSQLSGITSSGLPTASIYKSGQALQSGANWLIRQPTYDTWTTQFEGDGILQAAIAGNTGIVRVLAPSALIDAGTDGIDNDGLSGVDDLAEQETSAPFPVSLRGIKISVRMEDPAARQFNQMSVSKEFVTQ